MRHTLRLLAAHCKRVLEGLQAQSKFNRRVVAKVDLYTLLIQAVSTGGGFAVVVTSSVGHQLKEREFCGATIDGFEINRKFFRRRDRPLTRASSAVLNLINEQVARLAHSNAGSWTRQPVPVRQSSKAASVSHTPIPASLPIAKRELPVRRPLASARARHRYCLVPLRNDRCAVSR